MAARSFFDPTQINLSVRAYGEIRLGARRRRWRSDFARRRLRHDFGAHEKNERQHACEETFHRLQSRILKEKAAPHTPATIFRGAGRGELGTPDSNFSGYFGGSLTTFCLASSK